MLQGMGLLWRPEVMSLHVISDAHFVLAYFSIPVALLRFVRARHDLHTRHEGIACCSLTEARGETMAALDSPCGACSLV